MHELTIAQRLVDRAVAAAAERGRDRVDALTVELGTATHLTAAQLRFCVETVADGTPAADATVAFERVDPAGECGCGWAGGLDTLDETVPAAPSLRCPDCGERVALTGGRECRLTSIEIPDP